MKPITVWQGDEHILRMNVDEVNDGNSVGDLNLGGIVSFSYSIGVPGQWPLVNRTYLTDDIVNGADSSGNVIVPIVGDDTRDMTPGRYTFQVWMTQEDGREYTILECDIDVKDKLKDDSQGSGDSVVFVTSISASITLGQPIISGGSNVVYATGIPSTSGVGSPAIGTEDDDHYIFHPDDTFIKTPAWISARPAGEVHTCIEPKIDAYIGPIDLAVGAGRNGKNAIRMRSNGQTASGDPSFWMIPLVASGGGYSEPTGDDNFILPVTKRANRIEAWFRFPPGYRKIAAAAMVYYEANFVFGTYSTYPAGGSSGNLTMGEESDFSQGNGHWYHLARTRWDWMDDNEWVRVTVHGIPGHMRADTGRNNPPKDPTTPHGDYFRCLTRCYMEWPPYWWNFNGNYSPGGNGLPEISPPYDIYCDSIRLYWRDEYLPVEIRFGSSGDWFDGQEYECAPAPTTTSIPFRITNVTGESVTGRLAHRGRNVQWSPIIIDQVSSAQFAVATYTLLPGETKHFWLRVSPTTDVNEINSSTNAMCMGVVFEPSTEFIASGPVVDTPWGANMVNKTSNRMETSAYHGVGGSDYDICARNVQLVRAPGGHTAYRPTSKGGEVYAVPPTVTSQFQLPGHIPGGGTLTFAKGQSQSGRGTLTISSSGLVTYTPPSAGWTGTCHFSYQINGASAKPSIWYGAWVHVSA